MDSHHQRYFSLFAEAYPGLACYLDRDFRYRYLSHKYEDWFELKIPENLGRSLEEIVGREAFELRRPRLERALNGEKVVFESHIKHKKLGLRSLEQTYQPDIAEDGSVRGIFAIAEDVTEKVEARQRADENQSMFRMYAESMPLMAFIADETGKVIYFNPQWKAFSGKDPYTLEDTEALTHPDDKALVRSEWQKCVNSGEIFQIEERILNREGHYRWHLSRAIPIRNFLGEITKWLGTVTDIHEYKEIEKHQSRLIQVLDGSYDFISMTSMDGKILYLNEVARETLGIDREVEIAKLSRRDFFFDEDLGLLKDIIIPMTLNDGSWVGEVKLRHFKTGEPVWVHYNSFITKDEATLEVTGFGAIARDLTEIKRRERELVHALRTRDEFLSIASHELKTPLTSLKLQSQMFLRSLERGDEKPQRTEKLKGMAIQSNELVSRLSRLIEDMLDVSRIRNGRLNLDRNPADLLGIAQTVLESLQYQIQSSGLEAPTLSGVEGVVGNWDAYRLEQVLKNLVTNAIRYGRGKPIRIEISKENGLGKVRVIDQGYGISQEDQERIFVRFERAIDASEVSGMGLGLFIAKEIIHLHEGQISVNSELGKGSTFTVELPIISE